MSTVNEVKDFVADMAKDMLKFHEEMNKQMEETMAQLRGLEKDVPEFKAGNDMLSGQLQKFAKNGKIYQQIVDIHAFDKAQEVLKK